MTDTTPTPEVALRNAAKAFADNLAHPDMDTRHREFARLDRALQTAALLYVASRLVKQATVLVGETP